MTEVINLDKVYVHSIDVRFGKIQEHIKDLISESCEFLVNMDETIENFEKVLERAGIILHTFNEDLREICNIVLTIVPEEKEVGREFIKEFYLFLGRKTGCSEIGREFIKGYKIEYRICLLERFMEYLQDIYKNTGYYQSTILEEFKDVPGGYFDIDQKKIDVILSAPPMKFKRGNNAVNNEEKKESEQNNERKLPVILLNSKNLTKLQIERFSHNHFLDKYDISMENPDLEILIEIKNGILEHVLINIINRIRQK